MVSKLVSRIGGLASSYLNLKTAEEVMNISDTYTNTLTHLGLITNNLKQQKQLQNEVFAATQRSRGSYTNMANAVANFSLADGNYFKNNDQIVKFTETMQKMFRLGGTSTADQASTLSQLQQSLGSGKLQGQDFGSIVDKTPLVGNAVAKYMNVSIGNVRQLATEGKITSDVLINSILGYSQAVDQQMSGMSYTFGDYWNEIKTGATEAFGSVFENMTKVMNSKAVQSVVNGIVGSFSFLAGVANGLLNVISSVCQFFASNWTIIRPIILGIAAAMGIVCLQTLVAAAATAWKTLCDWAETAAIEALILAQDVLNAVLAASPTTWIIMGIIAVIVLLYVVVAVINKVTGSSISVTGILIGSVFVIAALFKNLGLTVADVFLAIWNVIKAVAGNISIAFNNAWANAQTGFFKFISIFLFGLKLVLSKLNKIPGVKINTSDISTAAKSAEKKASGAWSKKKRYQDVGAAFSNGLSTYDTFQSGWASDAYSKGKKTFTSFKQSVSKGLKNLKNVTSGATGSKSNRFGLGSNRFGLGSNGFGLGSGDSGLDATGGPTTVKGTGSGGAVSVDIADQDIQYLRDLAEKDYVARFSTATLAPNITVKVNSTKSEDLNGLKNRITTILQEGITTAAEGNYV